MSTYDECPACGGPMLEGMDSCGCKRRIADQNPCPICGADMEGRRRGAIYCSDGCRVEAWRVRQLLKGKTVDGYSDLRDRMTRTRRPSGY